MLQEVLGSQCLFVSLPLPTTGSDGEIDSYPTVLDCGCGSGNWIDRLLREKLGNVDVGLPRRHGARLGDGID